MGNLLWRRHRFGARPCLIALLTCTFVLFRTWSLPPSVAWGQDDNRFGEPGRGIRIVLVPEKNAFVLRSQFKPIVDFLVQKTGRTMYLEVAADYKAAVRAFVDHEADIGFLGGNTYLLARQKAGVEPLVRPVWPERKNICRSYIFVRKESDIRELNAMQGKRLAVVDRMSLSGFIFADCLFANLGMGRPVDFFDTIIWAGSHDTSIWSVVTGEADVGVAKSRVFDDLLREYPGEMENLLVLNRSAELPTFCCVVSRDFPETDKERLVFLFSQMDKIEEGRKALAALGAETFVRAYDAEYNNLRQAFAGGRCGVASDQARSSDGSR